MMMRGTGARRPAASEFGLGPRSSAAGHYVATLEAFLRTLSGPIPVDGLDATTGPR